MKPPRRFLRPPFVVVGRHDNRKSVRQCDPIQINAKRCKNLTGVRFGVLQAPADVPLDTIADAVAAQLSLARKRLILQLGHWKPDRHDRRTLPSARRLGRLHGAVRGWPSGRLRAVCARPCAVEHARRHPRDGALAVAHRAARHSRRLARGKGTHRRRSLPRGILGRGARRRRLRACARARDVRPCLDPRRLRWLVVGGPRPPCPPPAAAVPVPGRYTFCRG